MQTGTHAFFGRLFLLVLITASCFAIFRAVCASAEVSAEVCGDPITAIYTVHGDGFSSPLDGSEVFDVLGKKVATLIDEEKNSGKYKVEFDGSNLISGVYFYQLKAGDFIETKKMIFMK